jgi:hypothetical protein
MAQIDELDLLKALRQPWVAPRQPSTPSQPKTPRTPAQPPRKVTATYQFKPR